MEKKIRTNSMMSRLMAFIFFIILFGTLFTTIACVVTYSKAMRDNAYSSTAEIQNQVQTSIDFSLRSVSESMSILGGNESVQGYLTVDETKEPERRLRLETEVRNLLLSYSLTYKNYFNVVVISEKGQYLSNDSYRIQRIALSNEDWYKKAVEAGGSPVIIGNTIGRNLQSWKNYSADSYISVVQAVYDKQTEELSGVILVDLDITEIKNMVASITLGEKGFVYVADKEGRVIYSPENKTVYRIRSNWFSDKQQGHLRSAIAGEQYDLIYAHSDYTGLSTVGVYNSKDTIRSVSNIKYSAVLIAVITLVVSCVWAVLFSASFTKPIKQLSKLMKKAQTGDLTVRFNGEYGGEIKNLGEAFNSMVDKINQLIQMVYQEQKNKREAEMKILQEQIKPHFLYNTLDTIQWMAKKHGAADVMEIVRALSQFFRISLSRGKEYISLQDELIMVSSYLDIQKFRYDGLFEYEVLCEDNLKKYEIIKLTLQPLVENALYHGIKESDLEKGHIRIKITMEQPDILLLTIEDDGIGMTQQQCHYLNEILAGKERPADAKAFGTLNVSDRIKLSYGEEYGLFYNIRETGGTRVQVRVKAQMRGMREAKPLCGKW